MGNIDEVVAEGFVRFVVEQKDRKGYVSHLMIQGNETDIREIKSSNSIKQLEGQYVRIRHTDNGYALECYNPAR